jgi:hypothetical protein
MTLASSIATVLSSDAPQGEAGLPEPLDIADEAESARAANLAAIDRRRQFDHLALATHDHILEIDLDVEAESALGGSKLGVGLPALGTNRPQHLDVAARHSTGHQPHGVDGRDERSCAAVQDRHLRAVDLDENVVDAQPAKGGHEMLDGCDRAALALAEHGAEFSRRNGDVAGLDEGVTPVGQTGP